VSASLGRAFGDPSNLGLCCTEIYALLKETQRFCTVWVRVGHTALLFRREAIPFPVPLPAKSLGPSVVQFLSVITPVYNEENNVPLLVDQLFEVLAKCPSENILNPLSHL